MAPTIAQLFSVPLFTNLVKLLRASWRSGIEALSELKLVIDFTPGGRGGRKTFSNKALPAAVRRADTGGGRLDGSGMARSPVRRQQFTSNVMQVRQPRHWARELARKQSVRQKDKNKQTNKHGKAARNNKDQAVMTTKKQGVTEYRPKGMR